MSSQVVHEGLNQEVSGEVEDQAEGDGDGQRRQSLLKDGQQQQSEAQALRRWQTGVLQVNGRCVSISETTTYDKNGDEAGERRVPVSTCRRSFSNQNTVEDEIAEAEFHASCRWWNTHIKYTLSEEEREQVCLVTKETLNSLSSSRSSSEDARGGRISGSSPLPLCSASSSEKGNRW